MERLMEPKWYVLLYGLYLIGRAVAILFDPNFAHIAVDTDVTQWDIYIFEIKYLPLSFLHPIIFALVSVEVAKRAYPFALFIAVISLHAISIALIGMGILLEFGHRLGYIGLDSFTHISSASSVNEPQEALKGLSLVVLTPIIYILAIYWWKKPVRIFTGAKEPETA